MIKSFLFQLIEISFLTGIIILILLVLAPVLNKRYVARWKCAVWLLLAIRLLLPIKFDAMEPLFQIELPINILDTGKNIGNREMEISTSQSNRDEQTYGYVKNTFFYPKDEIIQKNLDIQEKEDNQFATNTKDIANFQNDNFNQESKNNTQYHPLEITFPAKNLLSKLIRLPENADFWNTISNIIFVIWLAGAVSFAMYHLLGYYIYRKNILRWGRKCEDTGWMDLFSKIGKQMYLKKTPDIIISKNASSPMILGLVHPILVMPREHYTEHELTFIFQHELTHYKRKDVLYKLVLLGANAIHWFHPAVYLMFREASGDLECSCDDRVMEHISAEGRRAYTEIIFNYIFRQKINERNISTYFYGGKKNMKNRFENIMNTKPKKQGKPILMLFLCVCLCLGNLVGCSSKEEETSKEEKFNQSFGEIDQQAQFIQKDADIVKAEQNKIEEQKQILEAVKQQNATEEDGFYEEAYYGFATENEGASQQETKKEINVELKNAQTVTILAHVKEKIVEEENYFVISSDTNEFPGAFVVVVDPNVYAYGSINGGEWFKITMETTDETYGGLPLCNCVEMKKDELFDSFLAGDIAAEYVDSSEGKFYITDLPIDEEDAFSYSIGDRVDLDNDGELELILNGIYGGKYLDAREGRIFVLDEGWGTAGVISYTNFDGKNWIVHSDTTHGGRYVYDFSLYDSTGKVADTFQLTQEFWETPEVPDGPGTVYTYRNEQITKEEYEELKEKMLHSSNIEK